MCTSHYLDIFITFIICLNVVTMSLEHYNQPKVGLTVVTHRPPCLQACSPVRGWCRSPRVGSVASQVVLP